MEDIPHKYEKLAGLRDSFKFVFVLLTDNNSDTDTSDEPPPLPDKCADSTTPVETPPIHNRQAGHRKSKVNSLFTFRRNSKLHVTIDSRLHGTDHILTKKEEKGRRKDKH